MARTTSGVQITRAMHVITQLGWTTAKLAAELGVHPRTTVRWARGVHTPAPRNLRALRGLVAQLGLAETAKPRLTRAARLLERAHDALLTDGERAELDAMAREMAGRLRERRAAEEAAAAAAVVRRNRDVAGVLGRPVRSVTARVDPFELVRSAAGVDVAGLSDHFPM